MFYQQNIAHDDAHDNDDDDDSDACLPVGNMT